MQKKPRSATALHPSASFSLTLRLAIKDVPGMFARVATAIGRAGGSLGAMDLVAVQSGRKIRDIVVLAANASQSRKIIDSVQGISGISVIHYSDRTFLTHLGGKIEVVPRIPAKTRDDLSMIYTPGVGRVCMAVHDNPETAWSLTIKKNTIAVVSDGTAVLGLGDIGPEAAMPVMEGKAILFKVFAGLNAFPICLATKDPGEIVETVVRLAPSFGGINLEDISAPRCFQIERELTKRLDIPVMHDDQHGTAVVVLAAFLNALKIVRKKPSRVRVVMAGVGASGTAVTRMLQRAGVRDIIGFDRAGALYAGRTKAMNPEKEKYAATTNPRRFKGDIATALKGAHVFIGLSGPGVVTAAQLRRMARGPVVFCLSNPIPEVMVEELGFAKIVATGRSDYPNQVNNALAFPGIFRGALDVRARRVNEAMKLAAARALAAVVKPKELSADYILPSIFNPEVAKNVASAVSRAAIATGMARRARAPMVR
jgi:malate dehydrogenase (oxaloacetate-decarboxylating)